MREQYELNLSVREQALGQLHLASTRSSKKTAVFGEGLDGVDTVVKSTLDIVEEVLGGATQQNGGGLGFLLLCCGLEEPSRGLPWRKITTRSLPISRDSTQSQKPISSAIGTP